MLTPDKTPNGNVIPLSETYGERAKVAFNEDLNSGLKNIRIMVFPPIKGNLDDFIWDEGRWWLNDIEWTNYLDNTQ